MAASEQVGTALPAEGAAAKLKLPILSSGCLSRAFPGVHHEDCVSIQWDQVPLPGLCPCRGTVSPHLGHVPVGSEQGRRGEDDFSVLVTALASRKIPSAEKWCRIAVLCP